MLSLALTAAEYRSYMATLASNHEMKVTVQILTNEHRVVSTVTQIFLDGQIDGVSAKVKSDDIEVSRSAKLKFLDPSRSMTFDSDSPSAGALYLNRMIRIIYSVRCPFGWVDVPVFTGPVVKCDRDGDMVDVEAQGKEVFGLRDAYDPATYKGRKTDAIKAMLSRSGEISRYWNIPGRPERLTSTLSVARDSKLWVKAVGVASSMGYLLQYNARGIAYSRPFPSKSCVTIRSGDGGLLMSDPQVSFSSDELVNIARVVGGKPRGSKKAIVATTIAPRSHPLSPWSIGRNGKPTYLLVMEENSNLRTYAQAKARATALVRRSLVQQIDATYELLPIPHLEPWDIVTVKTDRFTLTQRCWEFSLPLRGDALMTLGYTKNLARPRRIVRRS